MSSDSHPLREIADVQGGYAFKSADFGDEGVAVVKIANIQPPVVLLHGADKVKPEKLAGLDRFALNEGDVLMAMTGATVGKVGRFRRTEPAYLNQRVARISAKKGREFDDFIYAILSLPGVDKLIEGSSAGSAQANISATGIGAILVPRLPEHEQLLVGKFARLIDDRITLLRETNATLEAIAQALFKSWFVDFDPVRAKQQGRAPEGMDEATAALFPDAFAESELGLVPKGWGVGAVEDLCAVITNGGTPSRSNKNFWDDGTIPWFKTGDFSDGFLLSPVERITDAALAGSSAKLLPENSILMAIYAAPTVGRLGILTEPATFNQACTGMLAKREIGTWFLYWTLYFGREWFNSRANGAAQQNISKAIVASYRAVVPSEMVLRAFNESAETLHSKIRACSEQAQALTTLRDTLLPRLISGQLRLPEAEALIEEIA